MKNRLGMTLCALLLTSVAFAQTHSDAHPNTSAVKPETQKTDVQRWFDQLKSLNGSWQGAISTVPVIPEMGAGDTMNVTLRVTSLGNAIYHNMTSPKRKDDPVTMLYMDNGKLMLTHYCDAGNRPRMEGKLSGDGKSVVFEMIDVSGPLKYGHMNRAVFTLVDADHHIEEWTYSLPDGKQIRARFDLSRKAASGN